MYQFVWVSACVSSVDGIVYFTRASRCLVVTFIYQLFRFC
jgi:hypothetical protein